MGLKDKLGSVLYNIRNPQSDEQEKIFLRRMGFVRLLIFVPFLVAAIIVYLLSGR